MVGGNHSDISDHTCEVSEFKTNKFRGTDGNPHERYVIPLNIIIGGKKENVELSLADRSSMRYPILIGRRVLKGKYLVDVNKKY